MDPLIDPEPESYIFLNQYFPYEKKFNLTVPMIHHPTSAPYTSAVAVCRQPVLPCMWNCKAPTPPSFPWVIRHIISFSYLFFPSVRNIPQNTQWNHASQSHRFSQVMLNRVSLPLHFLLTSVRRIPHGCFSFTLEVNTISYRLFPLFPYRCAKLFPISSATWFLHPFCRKIHHPHGPYSLITIPGHDPYVSQCDITRAPNKDGRFNQQAPFRTVIQPVELFAGKILLSTAWIFLIPYHRFFRRIHGSAYSLYSLVLYARSSLLVIIEPKGCSIGFVHSWSKISRGRGKNSKVQNSMFKGRQ